MMGGRISGDNKYIDAEGVWRWDDGNQPLTAGEMARFGLIQTPKIEGGWCAPLGEGPAWLDIPEISVRRGGIQHPVNIVTTIRFRYRAVGWWRSWLVQVESHRSGTLYDQPWDGGVTVIPLVRFWRRSDAAQLVRALDVAAGTR